MAAAWAAGGQPPPQAFARQPPQQRHPPHRQHQKAYDEGQEELEELPNVDDLEVAAAAAGVAPVPTVLAEMGYYELGVQPKQAVDGSSSEEESEGSSSSEEEGEAWWAGWADGSGAALGRAEGRCLPACFKDSSVHATAPVPALHTFTPLHFAVFLPAPRFRHRG